MQSSITRVSISDPTRLNAIGTVRVISSQIDLDCDKLTTDGRLVTEFHEHFLSVNLPHERKKKEILKQNSILFKIRGQM